MMGSLTYRPEPSVAVVIPVRDRAQLLLRAVQSVLAQSYQNLTLCVVDDGSTEDLSDLRRLVEQRGHCWIQQAPSGVSKARNTGVAQTDSELIAFLDSDDEWLPEKLEKQIEFHNRYPEILISQTDEIWIRHGRRVNRKAHHVLAAGNAFEHCLAACAISPSSVLLDRKLFIESGGFDEELEACEDYELWLRISAAHAVGFIDIPLIKKYGGHLGQLSRTIPALDRLRLYALLKFVLERPMTDSQANAVAKTILLKLNVVQSGRRKRVVGAASNDSLLQSLALLQSIITNSDLQWMRVLQKDNQPFVRKLMGELCDSKKWCL